MKKFNNRGNHFFIEIIPDVNEKGEWQGIYQLAIQGRRTNLDDDSFYALEQVCQMACASLSLMEDDVNYRDKVYKYLNTPDDSSKTHIKSKLAIDKIKDNVISVKFNKEESLNGDV